jgi:hypothetical protein
MSQEVNRLKYPVRLLYRGSLSWTNRVKYATLLSLGYVVLYAVQLHLAQSAQAIDSMLQPRSSGAVRAYAEFRTRGTNGFRIYVTGSPKNVRLVASRRHEAAIYLDRLGTANQNGIHATFGRVGKIDLRFHALRKTRRTLDQPAHSTGCDLKLKDKYGYFTGTVVFRGEERFTTLRRSRVYGRAAPAQRLKCVARTARPNGVAQMGNSELRPELGIGSLYPLRSFIAGGEAISGIRSLVRSGVSLNLAKLSPKGVPFRAESIQEDGRLAIIRLLVAKGTSTSFVTGPNKSAIVTPPKPFSGKGEYHGCAPRPVAEWQGSLNVSLPGLSNITFGGNKFDFSFKPEERCPPDK